MIQYNELQITPDGKYLVIDASIENSEYFNNVSIDSVIIDSQDTYINNGPSSNPIFEYHLPELEEYNNKKTSSTTVLTRKNDSYYYVEEGTNKRIRFILSASDLGVDLNKSLLFVYIIGTGTPSADTPCGFDNNSALEVVYNKYPIYKNSINYLNEFNNNCTIQKGFIDSILQYKALSLCIKTGNYLKAIEYWNTFYINNKDIIDNNICSCYEGN